MYLLTLIALGLANTSCKLLENLEGTFRDSTGRELVLSSKLARFGSMAGAAALKPQAISFELLLAGLQGCYVDRRPDGVSLYFLTPDLSTRREEAGLVFYVTEVAYFVPAGTGGDKVSLIQGVHDTRGLVMLDSATKTWQIGWSEQPTVLSLSRSAPK